MLDQVHEEPRCDLETWAAQPSRPNDDRAQHITIANIPTIDCTGLRPNWSGHHEEQSSVPVVTSPDIFTSDRELAGGCTITSASSEKAEGLDSSLMHQGPGGWMDAAAISSEYEV